MSNNQAINNLPDKIGVTAKLSISYKAPTFADQVGTLRHGPALLKPVAVVYRNQGPSGREERP